jgi:hypothetical protein
VRDGCGKRFRLQIDSNLRTQRKRAREQSSKSVDRSDGRWEGNRLTPSFTIISGQASGPRSIARQTGLDESYVRRILGYAFLAPDIIEAILNGRPPQNLTIEKLRENFPMSWAEQRMVANAIGDRQIPHR